MPRSRCPNARLPLRTARLSLMTGRAHIDEPVPPPPQSTNLTYSPRVFPLRSDAYLKLSVEIPRPYLRCCARRDRGIRLARSNPHRSTWATANARVDTRSVAPNINHLALVSECEPPLALHAQLVVAHWSDGQTFGGLCRLLRFALTIVLYCIVQDYSVPVYYQFTCEFSYSTRI